MPVTPPTSVDLTLAGRRLHLVQQGDAGPPVVLLHGLPTHAGLWHQVQPLVAAHARTCAIDLPGFGRSDGIARQDDLAALADTLGAALQALRIDAPVLVALDLGLLVALQWAARHPGRVRGLALMEGFFLPMAVGWKALPPLTRAMMQLARWPWLAEQTMVRSSTAVERMVRASVLRQMTPADIARYATPWHAAERRRHAWLNGIHAGRLVPPSCRPGDTVALIDAAAHALQQASFPKLLLTARPGMVVTPTTVREAQRRLSNLSVVDVGAGRHLLPEDQPQAVAEAIVDFLERCPEPGAGSLRRADPSTPSRHHGGSMTALAGPAVQAMSDPEPRAAARNGAGRAELAR